MKQISKIIAVLVLAIGVNTNASAHCEVPCGIYTDHLRIELIKEHIMTIEKAMKQIEALAEEDDENYNQIVRWTMTKEHHANLIQEIAEQYFMTQRIKPASPDDEEAYLKVLALRIVQLLLFEDTHFDLEADHITVKVDEGRFRDSLIALLEDLVAVDVERIEIQTDIDGQMGLLRVSGRGINSEGLFDQRRVRCHSRKFELAGASFRCWHEDQRIESVILMELAR